MNEERVAKKIAHYLSLSARQLDAGTATKLAKARALALSRAEARRPALGFAWATAGAGSSGTPGAWALRYWLPVLVLVTALAGVLYWQQLENGDAGEIDVLLLSDDLPVRAYTDHRFDAWLRPSQQH